MPRTTKLVLAITLALAVAGLVMWQKRRLERAEERERIGAEAVAALKLMNEGDAQLARDLPRAMSEVTTTILLQPGAAAALLRTSIRPMIDAQQAKIARAAELSERYLAVSSGDEATTRRVARIRKQAESLAAMSRGLSEIEASLARGDDPEQIAKRFTQLGAQGLIDSLDSSDALEP